MGSTQKIGKNNQAIKLQLAANQINPTATGQKVGQNIAQAKIYTLDQWVEESLVKTLLCQAWIILYSLEG